MTAGRFRKENRLAAGQLSFFRGAGAEPLPARKMRCFIDDDSSFSGRDQREPLFANDKKGTKLKPRTPVIPALLAFLLLLLAHGSPASSVNGKTGRTPILLIHGLGGDAKSWQQFVMEAAKSQKSFIDGGVISIFPNKKAKLIRPAPSLFVDPKEATLFRIEMDDNQNSDFKEQGKRVDQAVQIIKNETSSQKVILVGHSMGGLSARAYVQYFNARDIAGVITVATPHSGSFLAELNRPEFADKISIKKYFAESLIGIDLNSKAVGYLSMGSAELNQLNALPWPDGLPILSVAANDPKSIASIGRDLARIYKDTSVLEKLVGYAGNTTFCSKNLLMKFGDGVVPLCCQIAYAIPAIYKAVGPESKDVTLFENTSHLKANKGHTDKLIEVIERLEQLLTKGQKVSSMLYTEFVLDTSGSMHGPKLARAKEAVSYFCDALEAENQAGFVTNKTGLVAFGSGADELATPDTSPTNVKSKLARLHAGGGTNLIAGLRVAVGSLVKNPKEKATKIIVLLSDGLIGESMKRAITFRLLPKAVGAGIRLYTIGVGHKLDIKLLRKLARYTGGQYFHARNSAGLLSVFRQVRHASSGTILSFIKDKIAQGQYKYLPSIVIDSLIPALRLDLMWSGSELELVIKDPTGRIVSPASGNVTTRKGKNELYTIITSPAKGRWEITAFGKDVPKKVEPFSFIASAVKLTQGIGPGTIDKVIQKLAESLNTQNLADVMRLYSPGYRDDSGNTRESLSSYYVANIDRFEGVNLKVLEKNNAGGVITGTVRYSFPMDPGFVVRVGFQKGKAGLLIQESKLMRVE